MLLAWRDGGPGDASQAAFAEVEAKLPSLRGRRFYGYFDPPRRRYVACVVAREDDPPDLGLERGELPGGPYLRARLRGDASSNYVRTGPAFERLAQMERADVTRPWLELYRSEGEIDLLLPVS